MRSNPTPGGEAILIRRAAEAIAKLVGASSGSWELELRFEDGRFLNMRRHHGPIRTDDELTSLARAVGVLRD